MSMKLFAVAGFALALAALLPTAAPTQTLPTIRIGLTGADTFAEGFYGREMGFFQKAGINVEISTFATGGQISTAVAGGAIDIGISNTVQIAAAIGHGAPFVVIAGGGLYSAKAPTTILFVAAGSPLHTPKDLEGKTVAVTALKDLTEMGPRVWMDRNGADSTQTHFIELPFAAVPAALQRGTIDAGLLAEPWMTAALQSGTVRPLGRIYDAVAPEFLLSDWFTTAGYEKKNPDLVKRFVAAIYVTARWANANHERSGAILTELTKVDPLTVQKMTRASYASSLDPKLLQPLLALMDKYKLLDHPLTVDDLVTRGLSQ